MPHLITHLVELHGGRKELRLEGLLDTDHDALLRYLESCGEQGFEECCRNIGTKACHLKVKGTYKVYCYET